MTNENKAVSPRGQATKDRILDATLEFIQREGVTRLTTNHIARESGIKIGSIYHFFPNKEAVLVELMTRWQAGIQAGIREYLDLIPADTPLEQIGTDLVMQNIENDYEYSAAFDEISVTASVMPVLDAEYRSHLLKVATMLADHYMKNPTRAKGASKKSTIEFSLFLQGICVEGLSQIAHTKGQARDRHMTWLKTVITAAVRAFEESLTAS